MKKIINVFAICTLLLSMIVVPQHVVQAESTYDISQLEDGEYDIQASALHATNDEESAAQGFLNKDAKITINGDRAELTITAPNNDMMNFGYLEIEGDRAETIETEDTLSFTFELDELKEILQAKTSYEVPAIGLVHEDVGLRFQLDGLDEIPEIEEEEEEKVQEQAGQPVDFQVDVGAMERYIENITMTDDQTVIVRFNSGSMIPDFKVDLGQGLQSADRTEVGEDFVDYEFTVDQEDTVLDAQVFVKAGNYESDYLFKLTIGHPSEEDGDKEETEQPEEKPEDPEKQPEEPEEELSEGKTIDYVINQEDSDDISAADNFFEKPGKLIEKEGQTYLEVTVTSWSMIDDLKADGQEVIVIEEDKDKDTAIVHIPVHEDVSQVISLTMKVTVPGLYETEHTTRLVMDEDSLEEESKEEPDKKPGNESEKPNEKPGKKPEKPKEDEKAELVADKVYNLDYTIMHETKNEPSIADDFFNKPGQILLKDGIYYLQVTVDEKDWSMIEGLKIEGKDIKILKSNGKYLVQVTLGESIPNELLLDMFINVPGLYEANHKARLILNEESLKEVDQAGMIIGSTGETPPNPTHKTPNKPTFGDASSNGEEKVTPTAMKQGVNPKTGDEANIGLYGSLFAAALILLTYQIRRRKVI